MFTTDLPLLQNWLLRACHIIDGMQMYAFFGALRYTRFFEGTYCQMCVASAMSLCLESTLQWGSGRGLVVSVLDSGI